MLPFLKKKETAISGLIVKTRDPDESSEQESEHDSSAAINSCAAELIRAIHSKDTKMAAMALKDIFDILGSMHEEEENMIEPNSFEDQNRKAGLEEQE